MSSDADFMKAVYVDKNIKNHQIISEKHISILNSNNSNNSKQNINNKQNNFLDTKLNPSMPGQKIELSCSKEADEVYCTLDFDSDADLFTQDRKSSPSSSVGRISPTPLLHLNQASCCRKCKCCVRPFQQNNRSQEIAFRLKEKSKRKMEMELKSEDSGDFTHPACRSQSNDSDITCIYDENCRCKECVRRAKLCAELIAEEESNKKKKQKKKKKKQKKHDVNDNNDDDEDEFEKNQNDMKVLKDVEEEEFSYNPPVMFNEGNNHYKIANPIEATSMEQWIPVKTKAKTEVIKSNKSVPTTPNNIDKCENINFISEQKKKTTSIDALTKELSNSNLNDSNKSVCSSNNAMNVSSSTPSSNILNTSQVCTLTNPQKARLIAIDADLADKRDEISYAIELITEAIQLDPKNPIFYINRSYYYERMTKYQKALEDAEKAYSLEDNTTIDEYREYSLFRRAKAYEGLEDYDNAETDLNLFLKLIENKSKTNPDAFAALLPRIQKNLLMLRIKKLVHRGYSLPLSRLYAIKFSTIRECLEKIKMNCRTLKHKCELLDLHLQIFNLQCSNDHKNISYYNEDGEFNSDEEIYLSDDDEFDILYSKDRFTNPKDILNIKNNPNQYYTEEYHEQLNSKGQKALWIGNIAPNCDATLASGMFSKFGNVTFCRNFTNENPSDHSSDVGYLLLHYDNDISPKLVMAYFREEVIPGLSKDGSYPLLIRFRNKNDKDEDEANEPAPTIKEYQNSKTFQNSGSKQQQPNSECYYWRTTGCDRERCLFKHIPANKGIDKQHWMRRKH